MIAMLSSVDWYLQGANEVEWGCIGFEDIEQFDSLIFLQFGIFTVWYIDCLVFSRPSFDVVES
jgi:hypothetical protein